MLSANENRPTGKSGQRKGRKKAGQRTKADEQQLARTDESPAEGAGQETGQQASPDINPPPPSETSPAVVTQAPASEPTAPLELVAVSPQAIANAYADYTMKSLERSWALFGKLASARSPAEAFAFQMEFAKEACESFVAESRKIVDLHEELVKQRVMHFEGWVAKVTQTTFELRATRH
ncbi:phasin family protein [Bradyrhizobium sp. CB1650]|uniref:phasin family protein n=1 Tax=Bradyrhizobium sp. CB1650 TaxID=3039153 RepID=UPI002435418E|nr:phasin family protein [Bradyrhizobium sp. CB1650]WGD48862.1 phasin family protein [Bradyrhizobium sp. CB1650]